MNKSGSIPVTPVGSRLRKQMNNDYELSWPEIVANPKHDESKDEEIVQDEMASNIGCGRDESIVAWEEVPDIADLRKEE